MAQGMMATSATGSTCHCFSHSSSSLAPGAAGLRRPVFAACSVPPQPPAGLSLRRDPPSSVAAEWPVGALARSTSTSLPYEGRVGLHRRDSNASLLSFRGGDEANAGRVDGLPLSSSTSSINLSAMLPYVVAATAVAALTKPVTFSWVSKEYYGPALGGIMLSIGIKLSLDDFALAVKRPLPLSIGFMAQYLLKPLLGLLIAKAFGVPFMFYAGFILTCCVSGAQLSSYASSLGKGDVAISILLTSITTLAAAVLTPVLTGLLIGSAVPIDAVAMSKSILQVVLVPVSVGLVLNTYAKSLVDIIKPVMPLVAMICTSLCIGSPLAINSSQILSVEGLQLLFPVLSFHVASFALGYWMSKLSFWRQEESVCRTLSLCSGMQGSTLAGLLATQFLGSTHAVPTACSVVVMAIMGLCLASFWGNGSRIRDMRILFSVQKACPDVTC